MPSQLNPADVLVPGRPVSKDSLRNLFETVQHELDAGGFFKRGTAAGSDRTVADRLSATVSVKDFGALGDGIERKLGSSANALRVALQLDLRPSILGEFDTIDAEDTLDYLAFLIGIKTLDQRGGGTLLVPPGTYVTRRVLPHIYDDVAIVGTGATPAAVVIRNTYDPAGKTGFNALVRANTTMFGSTHPAMFNPTNAQAAARYDLDPLGGQTIKVGQTVIKLANAADAANLSVGQGCWICDTVEWFQTPEAYRYKQSLINVITAIDVPAGTFSLKYPVAYEITSGKGKVFLSRTADFNNGRGKEATPKNIALENLTLVSQFKHNIYENGAIDSTIRRVKGQVFGGFMGSNQMGYCLIEQIDSVVHIGRNDNFGRGLELKGTCFKNTYRRIKIKSVNAGTGTNDPLIQTGENFSDCSMEEIQAQASPAHSSGVGFLSVRNCRVRNLEVSGERAGFTAAYCVRADVATATNAGGAIANSPGVMGWSDLYIEGFKAKTGTNGRAFAIGLTGTPAETLDHLEITDLDSAGPPPNTVVVQNGTLKSGVIANIRRPEGFGAATLFNNANVSYTKGAYAAPLADLTNPASPANMFLRRFGRPILCSDANHKGRRFDHDGSGWRPSDGMTLGTAAPAATPAAAGLFHLDTASKKLYLSAGTASAADWTLQTAGSFGVLFTTVIATGMASMPAGSGRQVQFAAAASGNDTLGIAASAGNALTIPTGKGGRYFISGSTSWSTSSSGNRGFRLKINGTFYDFANYADIGATPNATGSMQASLADGDVVTMFYAHSAGTAQTPLGATLLLTRLG